MNELNVNVYKFLCIGFGQSIQNYPCHVNGETDFKKNLRVLWIFNCWTDLPRNVPISDWKCWFFASGETWIWRSKYFVNIRSRIIRNYYSGFIHGIRFFYFELAEWIISNLSCVLLSYDGWSESLLIFVNWTIIATTRNDEWLDIFFVQCK